MLYEQDNESQLSLFSCVSSPSRRLADSKLCAVSVVNISSKKSLSEFSCVTLPPLCPCPWLIVRFDNVLLDRHLSEAEANMLKFLGKLKCMSKIDSKRDPKSLF
jgi:hypothetical protein